MERQWFLWAPDKAVHCRALRSVRKRRWVAVSGGVSWVGARCPLVLGCAALYVEALAVHGGAAGGRRR